MIQSGEILTMIKTVPGTVADVTPKVVPDTDSDDDSDDAVTPSLVPDPDSDSDDQSDDGMWPAINDDNIAEFATRTVCRPSTQSGEFVLASGSRINASNNSGIANPLVVPGVMRKFDRSDALDFTNALMDPGSSTSSFIDPETTVLQITLTTLLVKIDQ
jgi:hypothetical protein